MSPRVPVWAGPGRSQVPEPFTWISLVLRVVGVPAMAALWWALAFLPWKEAGLPSLSRVLPPTVPLLFTDLEVAVFGPIGASLVVAALFRQRALAFLSVLLGFGIPTVVTLIRGAETFGNVLNTFERVLMLVICALSALAGLAIGAVAITSLQRFGFLGLLAVTPVVSLLAVLLLDARADSRWLTRSALVVLLVMISWRRSSAVVLWPIFFVLFWLLHLVMSAVGYGAQTLRHPGGGGATTGTLAAAMVDFARSAWSELLEISWQIFWPAAVIAALVVAAQLLWRRFGQVGTEPVAPNP